MKKMKQPLVVHIVFHPESEVASEIALRIHRALNDDPAVPGLRIPTSFALYDPPQIDLSTAEDNVVVVLAEPKLDLDDVWCSMIADLHAGGTRLIPLMLDEDSWPLDPRLREQKVSFAKAFLHPDPGQYAERRVVIELIRYLLGTDDTGEHAPFSVFVSHAKRDLSEPGAASTIVRHPLNEQPIEPWVDSANIEAGADFAEVIRGALRTRSVLCVATDNYGTREWCRREVLEAKRLSRPMVVVNALEKSEVRAFPYLGNVPVIHWDGDTDAALALLAKETLRTLHDERLLHRQRTAGDTIMARPPELASAVTHRAKTILYPDPPLGEEERSLLADMDVTAETPLGRLARDRHLNKLPIALSGSPSDDIARFGFTEDHRRQFMLELARYVLISGATLTYGGHMEEKSDTLDLFEIVRSHHEDDGIDPVERIWSWVGWPVPLSDKQRQRAQEVGNVQIVERPIDIDETMDKRFVAKPTEFLKITSAASRYAWSRGMTAMREQQIAQTRARIAIGGPVGGTDGNPNWYLGRMPGVLEEIYLAAKAGQPTLLIGAYGGATRLAIDIITSDGDPPLEATWDYQSQAPRAIKARKMYEERGEDWPDYPEMIDVIRAAGKGQRPAINPLLTRKENEEIWFGRDTTRLLQLVLKALGSLDL